MTAATANHRHRRGASCDELEEACSSSGVGSAKLGVHVTGPALGTRVVVVVESGSPSGPVSAQRPDQAARGWMDLDDAIGGQGRQAQDVAAPRPARVGEAFNLLFRFAGEAGGLERDDIVPGEPDVGG